ncbi:MAG: family N-acetyltransferase [Clostridia bacterium]|jgi:ribosomal protein S18 acetylase RimI-like enzyme|nr:family N-acetyltransferase [Clostridia bacterium]
MIIKYWSKDESYYDLYYGFSLEKAVNTEFAKYYAAYLTIDIGFKSSYEQKCSVVAPDDNCYWIKMNNVRVGGAFLEPNRVEGLFLIPPFEDIFKVLKLIKNVLTSWSDKSKDIRAVVVGPAQVDYYHMLGFRTSEESHWMMRPTESYFVYWEDKYVIRAPKAEDTEELGKFFYEAFINYVGKTKYSLEDRTSFVKDYFANKSLDELLLKASTLVYDKETNELIGVCLISEFRGWPLVSDIAVKATYRGLSLATRMLKKALSITKDKYPAMRLFVICGNEAESVYYNLGFIPGVKLTDLYLPAEMND